MKKVKKGFVFDLLRFKPFNGIGHFFRTAILLLNLHDRNLMHL